MKNRKLQQQALVEVGHRGQPVETMVPAVGSVICLCEDSQKRQDPAAVIILSPNDTDIFHNDAKFSDWHIAGIQ